MISTSVAVCRSISATASFSRAPISASPCPVIFPASAAEKPSSVVSSRICRASGVMAARRSLRGPLGTGDAGVALVRIEPQAGPEVVEQPVEPDLRAVVQRKDARIGDQRVEAGHHVRVPAPLGSGQRAGVAAQVGQVRSDFLR